MASIDISGIKGKDGYCGMNGHNYGESGQNGGPAEDGGNGGVAYLRLTRVPDNLSAILVSGTVHNQPFSKMFDLGPETQLNIDVRGGGGGRGGDGGHGHSGRPGHHGMNATQYSCGTNGGPGGPGGNGGNGTNGGHGGNGGFVQIIVSEADMDLLLMIAPIKIKGGRGGDSGLNGHGGSGGPGGQGGSSYSWTTTSYEHYTDANGHR